MFPQKSNPLVPGNRLQVRCPTLLLCPGRRALFLWILDTDLSLLFRILAEETAVIASKEQLSMGFQYYDENTSAIKEKLEGFSLIET